MWIAPTQIKILPIGVDQHEYAEQLQRQLEALNMRTELDERNEKIGYKIREAQLQKVPYMLVIGEKEMSEGKVAVRSRKTGESTVMTVDEFIAMAAEEIATFAK